MDEDSDPALSTQGAALIPEWCEWGRGGSPILLVAPHGGRRAPVDATAPPRHLRVNDIYTAEITRELATRLGAGFVINLGMDRNLLDLNRISQVRTRARWFLELLVQEIERVIECHGQAELLFVHGWNTGRAICDVGIGAVEARTGLRVVDGAHLAVTEAYMRRRVDALRAACERAQIRAPLGERYPASHRNNLLQLFTPRAAEIEDACARRIAQWVAQGRINALQLELGIPLRWPGPGRDKFIAAVGDAFASDVPARGGMRAQPRAELRQDPTLGTSSAALQFYDPATEVGLSAGIGHAGPRLSAGRLLLLLGGQRVALFTGEEVHAVGNCVGPLRIIRTTDGMRLEFAGPVLVLEDAAVYLDLEAALAQSRLLEAEVHIEFGPTSAAATSAAARFGIVRGVVRVDGQRRDVETGAFADAAAARASGVRQQTTLAAAFGREHAVLSRVVEGENDCSGVHFTPPAANALHAVRVAVTTDGDVYTPTRFELRCDGIAPLRGEPLSRMAILRPAADTSYLRVTFGAARYSWAGETGYGLYEYARPVVGK
jgi:hypothetical protein